MASAALLRYVADSAPDADLLRRFVQDREPEAFGELVRRHGPVVYRVCRRLLGPSSADDAFQATFLILATRPESVRKAGSVGSWLVGVAGRVARQMRKRERRFTASGGRQPPEGLTADTPRSPEWVEQFHILDEELTRLPDRLRGPVVICLLQGRTQEQAVAELGGSVRTIRRRLEEAKQLLRLRLERRGVVPAVAAGLAAGVGEATATVPAELPGRTVATVFDFLAGGAAVSAPAAVIAKGVAMGTLARKVKLLMVTAAVGLTALGVGLAGDEPKPAPQPSPGVTVPLPAPSRPVAVPAASFAAPALETGPVLRAVAMETGHLREQIYVRWVGVSQQVASGTPSVWTGPLRNLSIRVVKKGEPIMPPPTESVTVVYTRGAEAGSSSELLFADGRAIQAWVHLAGPLDEVLENDLPREMTHVVLASHLGKPLPRWAADGAAQTAESLDKQAEYDRACREMIEQSKAVRLSVLFPMTEYPKGQAQVVAQGHSVTRYLLSRKAVLTTPVVRDVPHLKELFRNPARPEAAFLAFAQLGGEGDWDKAVKAVYGFDDVAALEKAWIGWLSTPESRAAAAEPAPRPAARGPKVPQSPYIPPVNLPSDPPTPTADGVRPLPLRRVKLPVSLGPDQRKYLASLQLVVSRDEGQTWEVVAALAADQEHFVFAPKEDGLYWLKLRMNFKDGRRDPADFTRAVPDHKLLIDTTPPKMRVNPSGPAGVEWVVEDENLDPDGVAVEVRWQGDKIWTPFSPRKFAARDKYDWPSLRDGQLLEVRVIAKDRAGNEGSAVQKVNANRS